MRIDATASLESSSHAQKHIDPDHDIQSLFSSILQEQGRAGYKSAENVAAVSDELEGTETYSPLVAEQWHDWFDSVKNTRYSTTENRAEVASDFQHILTTAYESGAYTAPQAYLQSLNKEELETIQSIHHLASPIQPAGLTEEGAINLLLPPAAQIDLNNDGLTQSGKAFGIRFPDSQTPKAVVDAWNEATADMPPGDKMMAQFRMVADSLVANIRQRDDGTVVAIEPGEPGFRNLRAEPGYSYSDRARSAIEANEYFKHMTPPDQYEQTKEFWTSMLDALESHGSP